MSIIADIRDKAKRLGKRIVLPEGDEPRTVEAAGTLASEGIARPILLGNRDAIASVARELSVSLDEIGVIDPTDNEKSAEYASLLYETRKSKGMTRDEADRLVRDPMYYGVLAVKAGSADGLVSGAVHTTGDMLRPALRVIGTKPGMPLVSSAFIMECPDVSFGENGLLIYADCVVNPCPTGEQLAYIAVSAAETARQLCGISEPRAAFLSYSTLGSATGEGPDKMREAARLAHEIAPCLLLDGELQFDAATVPAVGASKAPGSPVAGRANVLIFPDLAAGNIAYKITQRLAHANCFAVLQGLASPCNDLSRGCSAEDIVNTCAMTCLQTAL